MKNNTIIRIISSDVVVVLVVVIIIIGIMAIPKVCIKSTPIGIPIEPLVPRPMLMLEGAQHTPTSNFWLRTHPFNSHHVIDRS